MSKLLRWILGSFKVLKLWQITVLVVAVLGSAWATYGIVLNTTSADEVELGTTEQIIPVQYGDLINQVSTNGSLIFPERNSLTFGSPGMVDRLLIREGQRVSRGELLAQLDHASVIQLERGFARARVDLMAAQESLAQLESDLALEIATAEQDVASAEVDLAEAVNTFSRTVPQVSPY